MMFVAIEQFILSKLTKSLLLTRSEIVYMRLINSGKESECERRVMCWCWQISRFHSAVIQRVALLVLDSQSDGLHGSYIDDTYLYCSVCDGPRSVIITERYER